MPSWLGFTGGGREMNSTSTSRGRRLLEVKHLHLSYDLNFFEHNSLRDSFVQLLSQPLKAVTRPKGQLHVLKDINFQVFEGEKIALIGVNGAGKTSLCRCIAEMTIPKHGEILAHGQVRAIFNPSIAILPDLTGRENAQILARLLFPESSEAEISEIVRESVDFSGLGQFADTPFKTFSKGMQARLCLALITAKPSDLMILDEAFDGADAAYQKKIAKRIQQVLDQSGAVIMVSHSIDQIESSCNRVIILSESQIAFDGPLEKGVQFYQKLIQGIGDSDLYQQHHKQV